ncbi:MAG: aldehyde dehydrogenase family protein [Candidatus Sericytochromatia bacterium]|nr:aldehyde dehydrogenase family protein [Candidatus Tanganyikabacteria bacterium]
MECKLYIDGQWITTDSAGPVLNKYDGRTIATLPIAGPAEVDRALAAAAAAAPVMARMPAHERGAILARASALLAARKEDLARTIAGEAGKALKFARIEADRAASTFAVASEEAKRLHGETIPLDAVPAGEGYFGFWLRRPVGVVAAIAPFNFPINLVAHKVAPALAAGNSIVLKPAAWTPLASVILCEILAEAGLPPGAINLVHGPGSRIGPQLVADPRVAKVTFTGSKEVGQDILARAGIKKVTLELGNTSPVVICHDADLDFAASRCAVGAFYNSGQVCISVQRIYCDRRVYEPFLEKLRAATRAMVVGDPLAEGVDVGPMIDARETDRIAAWVDEAKAAGATVVEGGRREGPVYWPTVLTEVTPKMRVVADEAFGPVVAVLPFDDFAEGLRQADDCEYGLQAAVFTQDVDRILMAVRHLNFGGVIVNDTPSFRCDHMPYGGNRQSGLGREGVRFAMEEMTNIQMVAIRSPG